MTENNTVTTPAPTPAPVAPTPASSNTWKYVSGVIIAILALISSFFGYSYKESTSRLDKANATISDLTTKANSSSDTEITKTPELLGGKIAYVTKISHKKKAASSTVDNTSASSTYQSFNQTITKKGNTLLGCGYGTDGSENVMIQSDLIGPFGLASTASFGFNPSPSFKEAVLFVTFKP
jgi:hypothetical protein